MEGKLQKQEQTFQDDMLGRQAEEKRECDAYSSASSTGKRTCGCGQATRCYLSKPYSDTARMENLKIMAFVSTRFQVPC
ncbi:hypothetical protein BHM03_00011774 [Ensete ventricosum]|nr:hypothetical protein BHM03_00011774 [Ensete ventricosum]